MKARTGWLGIGLAVLGVTGSVATLWMVFFWVPTEARQGVIQRIFYLHVPSAWVAFMAFGIVAFASAVYLWLGDERADMAALAAAEGGMVGSAPHNCAPSRDTRGTHVTPGPAPARMNTQPSRSTYCRPSKEAGGNGAGTRAVVRDGSDIGAHPADRPATAPITRLKAVFAIVDPFGSRDRPGPCRQARRIAFGTAGTWPRP